MNNVRDPAWPIIIGGCYRSGTSLVRRILNSHSAIYCGPEVHFWRDFHGRYQNDPYANLRFIKTARSIATDETLREIFGKAYLSLIAHAARMEGKRRWAEKNPDNAIYLNDWQAILGDGWLCVHVIRNPLDTLASIDKHPFKKTIPHALEDRIQLYRQYLTAPYDFAEKYPGRYFQVRYEQLVRRPEITIRGLMAWLGEKFEPTQLAFNQKCHQTGLEDPKIATTARIHCKSVHQWPKAFNKEDVAYITQQTSRLYKDALSLNRHKIK